MSELATYTVWVPTLMLVIFRVAGIFDDGALLSNEAIPFQVKVLFSVVIGLAVTGRFAAPVAMPGDWVSLVMGIGGELLIGGTIGFTANLLFMGIKLGSEQISQQMGIGLASVFNPLVEDTSNVLSTVFQMAALAIFLVLGGHRVLLTGLLETFDRVPLMGFSMKASMLSAVVSVLTAACVLAIKVAAPATVALFLASLSMGFIQRTMPQLNILSAGFQIRVMLGLAVLAVTSGHLVPLLQGGWDITAGKIVTLFAR